MKLVIHFLSVRFNQPVGKDKKPLFFRAVLGLEISIGDLGVHAGLNKSITKGFRIIIQK